MEHSTELTNAEIDGIINGCVDGVEPTTHEVAMAKELRQRRDRDAMQPVSIPTITMKRVSLHGLDTESKDFEEVRNVGECNGWNQCLTELDHICREAGIKLVIEHA